MVLMRAILLMMILGLSQCSGSDAVKFNMPEGSNGIDGASSENTTPNGSQNNGGAGDAGNPDLPDDMDGGNDNEGDDDTDADDDTDTDNDNDNDVDDADHDEDGDQNDDDHEDDGNNNQGGDGDNPNDDVNGSVDTDGDGIPDLTDNCDDVPNPPQLDSDGDGLGNVCDQSRCLANFQPAGIDGCEISNRNNANSHLEEFEFEFGLINKMNSDVNNEADWNSFKIRINFTSPNGGDPHIQCGFEYLRSSLNTPQHNLPKNSGSTGAEFSMSLNIENIFGSSTGCTTSFSDFQDFKNQAMNLNKLSDVRISTSDSNASLGIRKVKIYSKHNNGNKKLFYDNPVVMTYITNKVGENRFGERINTYPNAEDTFLGKSVHGGFKHSFALPGLDVKANGTGDEQGIRFYPAAPLVVFSPKDFAIKLKLTAANENDAGYPSSLNLELGEKDISSDSYTRCSDQSPDECEVNVFDGIKKNETRSAKFYSSGLKMADLTNGGILFAEFQSDGDQILKLKSAKLVAAKAWSNTGQFQHWILFKNGTPLTVNPDNDFLHIPYKSTKTLSAVDLNVTSDTPTQNTPQQQQTNTQRSNTPQNQSQQTTQPPPQRSGTAISNLPNQITPRSPSNSGSSGTGSTGQTPVGGNAGQSTTPGTIKKPK